MFAMLSSPVVRFVFIFIVSTLKCCIVHSTIKLHILGNHGSFHSGNKWSINNYLEIANKNIKFKLSENWKKKKKKLPFQ